ncbi:MAG: curved DNA-binding protein [Polyangiales bacterium]|jgi:curved DNA-binding protein
MAEQDYYKTLGVARSASAAEVKTAYRSLAKKLHPDRNPDDPNAESQFKKVTAAYEVISDPKKRDLFDRFGEMGLHENFDPNVHGAAAGMGGDFSDFFNSARGGAGVNFEDLFGGRTRAARPRKGRDFEAEVRVGFLDALRGTKADVAFRTGREERRLKVTVPAGTRDGGKIRLKGQGSSAPRGGQPGDLILKVKVSSHSKVWFEGNDLHLRVPITPIEAYSGAKIEVTTPHGPVQMSVPPGAQSGAKLRLRGKGVKGKKGGDLIAHLEVRLPKERSEKVEALLRELEEGFDGDVREALPDLS